MLSWKRFLDFFGEASRYFPQCSVPGRVEQFQQDRPTGNGDLRVDPGDVKRASVWTVGPSKQIWLRLRQSVPGILVAVFSEDKMDR